MIQAQAKANAESAEKAAMYEVQKKEALAQTELQLEKGKSDLELQQMQRDFENKMRLAEQQFGFDMQLKQMDVRRDEAKEQMIEDRKDQRTKLQATQQSAMIQQRQDGLLPTDFSTQPNGEPLAEQTINQIPQPENTMPGMAI
jgi:bisphosphoglycerate-dependent phosphoglycerate mutase